MRLYIEVARATRRRMSTYRGATFAGIFTNTVFGLILAYVLLAVFRQRPVIGGFDATDAVTFTFVTQGMLMVIGIFGDGEQSERIHAGEVAMELARPYDYQAWWAAVAYGKAAFYAVFRGIPPFVIGGLVLQVRLPAHAATWLAFLLSVTAAVGLAFAYRFIIEVSAFWLVEIRGVRQFAGDRAGLVDLRWRPSAMLLVVAAVLSGAVIYGAIWVLTSAIAFWTVETQEIASSFTYGGNTLANYPIDVFGAWLGRLVIFVVPIGFVAYLPAASLLGKPLPYGLPRAIGWASPLVATVLAGAAGFVWRLAIRHYRSTGL